MGRTSPKPKVLVISFSDIAQDARVIKQIATLSEDYRVTSCGYGKAPKLSQEHVSLKKREPQIIIKFRAALIRLKMYGLAYRVTPSVRAVKKLKKKKFDVVFANDLDAAGAALLTVASSKVHLDLHEYWLGLHDDSAQWNKLRKPFYDWQLKKFAKKILSVTTISQAIADRYHEEYGICAQVVINATPFKNLTPTLVNGPIRIVHSGGSQPSRKIENMIKAVGDSKGVTLDLYLVGEGTGYYQKLKRLAEEYSSNVRLLPPVPPQKLISTLNKYDVGIHVLPPTNSNNALALPNKFFDYVQARLAILIGPSPSMRELLEEHQLGIVTDDFSVESMVDSIQKFNIDNVAMFKNNAHEVAEAFSAEPQNEVWKDSVKALIEKPVMVFHVPFTLNQKATSASGIRPVKLRQAFESIGYRVLEISGRHDERKKTIKQINKQIKNGLKVDFVYSEAATTPTGLGEPVTISTSLTRDISFLRKCRSKGIPVGIFYRDIYWQFEEFENRVGKFYASLLRWRYKADLKAYKKAVDVFYLPSVKMAEYVSVELEQRVKELPPGSEIIDSDAPDELGPNLFYVGGLNSYYRMQETVKGVEATAGAKLIICTRETEWDEARGLYEPIMSGATEVVHQSGAQLEPLYDQTHIGSLLMEPIEYREFAAPMKLYEYLGHGKPIIATEGSLAAKFVNDTGIGWAVKYDAGELKKLLEWLKENPEELKKTTQNVKEVRQQHSWEARAKQVVSDLKNKGRL